MSSDPTRREVIEGLAALGAATLTPQNAASSENNSVDTQATFSQEWPLVNNTLDGSSRNPNSRVPDQNTSISMETSDNGFDSSSHVVFDKERMFLGEWSTGELFAFDRETGNKLWQDNIGIGGVDNPIAVGPNYVYGSVTGDTIVSAYEKSTGNLVNSQSLESAGEIVFDENNGNVIVTQASGQVDIFDEDLSNNRTFPRPGNVNIMEETTMVNGAGNVLYAEQNSDSDGVNEAHLRMLDPSNANQLDSVLLDGDSQDGAVLHNGLYVRHEDKGIGYDEEMVAYNINSNSIGGEEWRVTIGSDDENSPVVYEDKVIGGNENGEIYTVDINTGDKTVIDTLETSIQNLVSGKHTLVVGENNGGTYLYGLDEVVEGNANLITELTGDVWVPEAVIDGLLYSMNYDGNNVSFGAVSGDYRVVPPNLDWSIGTGPENVYGDTFSITNDSTDVSRADSYNFIVENTDGQIFNKSYLDTELPGSWNINDILKNEFGNSPEPGQYNVNLEAVKDGNIIEEISSQVTLDSLATNTVEETITDNDEIVYRIDVVSSTDYNVDIKNAEINNQGITLDTGDKFKPSDHIDITPGDNFTLDYTASINGVDYQKTEEFTYLPGPPPIHQNYPAPNDPDNDDLYEDVDGDGQTDIFDIQAFYTHRNQDEIQNHTKSYDFNNDNQTDILDIQTLFQETTGQ